MGKGALTPDSKSTWPDPMRARIISGESFGELANGVLPSSIM